MPLQGKKICQGASPPPSNFRPVSKIAWARMSATRPSFLRQSKPKGRRAQGLRYEKKVLEYLANSCHAPLLPSPWIQFQESETSKYRWCQPDGLLINPWKGIIILVEVKYQHTPDAWWQLRHLYGPVVSYLFPHYEIRMAEVCKWYDPAISFPERIDMLPAVERAGVEKIGVHIWKP